MNKHRPRLLAFLLCFALVFSNCVPAFADTLPENIEAVEEVTKVNEAEPLDEGSGEALTEELSLEPEKEAEDGEPVGDEDIDEDIPLASPSDAEDVELEDGEILDDDEIPVASPSNASKVSEEMELAFSDGVISLTMIAPEGAFKTDAPLHLEVTPIVDEELDALVETLEEEKKVEDKEAYDFMAVDIKVMDDEGKEWQPVKKVEVIFNNLKEEIADGIEDKTAEDIALEAVEVFHFNADGENPETVKTEVTEDEEGLEATAKHLSPWVIATPHSSLGDLWDNWDIYAADAYKPTGDGSVGSPYQIADLNNLIWLSVNTAAGTAGINTAEYQLTADIDLASLPASLGDWHPIGWYTNHSAPAASNVTPFRGVFNGQGHTISGLDIVETTTGYNLQRVGLFGLLDDAIIENLTVEAGTVSGYDYVGILAGEATGKTEIHQVSVSGSAQSGLASETAATAHIGGIVGNANGDSLTANGAIILENCSANVYLNSNGTLSYVGGIAGSAANAYIADSYVVADSSYDIQGKGYVGGICGYQTSTAIYNSYVDGVIGGNGSVAAGGITGKFQSGQIFVARFDGEIGSTNRQVTREGLFIGTRDANTTWVYGTTNAATAGYLYYTQAQKGKALSGSGIDGDASGVTEAAHTGFWTSNELKYTVMAGLVEKPCATDRYYYEELEDGIRFIVTQKLGRAFTVEDYASGLRFKIDHYAPSSTGTPVFGHLVSLCQINSQNSTDLDVAVFEAVAGNGSIFYKKMDKNSAAAVETGTTITVTSSAKNTATATFQRVVDKTVEPEMLERPTYTDEEGIKQTMDYQTGGAYTFVMPDSDTELNITYEKVLTEIITDPTETTITITQTRTGDRKNPLVTWNIVNENGYQIVNGISKPITEGHSITDELLSNSDTNYVPVGVIFNAVSADNKVMWTVDDASLINLKDTEVGVYTANKAHIAPEVTDTNSWLATIIANSENAQKNANYTTAIQPTVYEKKAVLTASTDPLHTDGNKSAYANCDVIFKFQIVDNTQLLTEGVTLDKESLTFTVTRRLTGNRRQPTSTYEVTSPQALKATITPADAAVKSVTWELTGDAATSLTQVASGTYNHDNTVSLNFNGTDLATMADWMKDIVAAGDAKKNTAATKNDDLTGFKDGEKTAVLTVTATDQELDVHKATCNITVKFETIDETPDVTGLEVNTDQLTYNITRILTGDRTTPQETYIVSQPMKVKTWLTDNAPFLEDVTWGYDAAITDAITKEVGGTKKAELTVGVNFDKDNISAAPSWVYNLIQADNTAWASDKYVKRSAAGSVTGKITAKTFDVTTVTGGVATTKDITVKINFTTDDQTVIHPEGVYVNPVTITRNVTYDMAGDIKSEVKSKTGLDAQDITGYVLPHLAEDLDIYKPYNQSVTWSSSDDSAVTIDQNGRMTVVDNAKWIKDAMKAAPYKAQKVVSIYCTANDNGKVGVTTVTLNFSAICLEEEADAKTLNVVLTASGSRSNPSYAFSGDLETSAKATTYPSARAVTYSTSNATILTIDANGKVSFVQDRTKDFAKSAMNASTRTATAAVLLTAQDASGHKDVMTVTVNLTYKDNTSSSGGGGGGGGSGTGAGPTGNTTKSAAGLPSYVIKGQWTKSGDGTWRFTSEGVNGHVYTGEWGAIFNPYATGTQAAFDWFVFGPNSVMITGWYLDAATGLRYYLSPISDNTLGHMVVGYQFIDGAWYYFHNVSDGTRGHLVVNGTTPDGHKTNVLGQIIDATGKAITDPAAFTATENTTASLTAAGVK